AAQTHADGLAAMQTENWDKAISIYTTLTKANPTDQTAFLTLGNAYLAKGDKEKAKAAFQAGFDAKNDSPLAYVSLGRQQLLQNNVAGADEQFKRAAKNGKKDSNVLRQVGESFLYAPPGVKPNFVRAEEFLKMAYDLNSKDFTALMTLGYMYKEKPDGGLAAQQYELAESLDPKNPLPKFMLAKVYKAAKLNDRYVEYLDRTIATSPRYTPALRAKAEYFYYGRKWEKAAEATKALIANGDALTVDDEMQLANILFITKDYPGSISLVEKIIQKDGSKNYLRRLLGYSYYETGDYPKGIEIMNDYFGKVTPEKVLPSDYQYLGRLQVKTKGDTIAAIENLKKAIEMDSSLWTLYKEIGELYYGKKDNCNSAIAYQMYQDSVAKPDPADLYKLGLAQYYCKADSLGRYPKSEKTFLRITELVPTAGIGWLWAGKAATKLEVDVQAHPDSISRFGRAKPYWEKYVAIGSLDKEKNKKDLITAYEYLSYYYYLQGDAANTEANAAKLLELDPTNATGTELMKNAKSGTMTPITPGTPTPPIPPPTSGGGKGKK
ncbi:MAG: tetratricopeptide repeat protein, partial [Saprospiraceae bacterium]